MISIDIDDRRFSVKEAAAKLGISKPTLYREMRDGKLGYVRMRGRRYFTEAQMRQYLAAGLRHPR